MRSGHCFLVHFFEGDAFVVIVKFQKEHFMFTIRTVQWIVFKRRKDSSPPSVETAKYMAFFF